MDPSFSSRRQQKQTVGSFGQDRKGEQRDQYYKAGASRGGRLDIAGRVDVHPALSEWMQKKQAEKGIGQPIWEGMQATRDKSHAEIGLVGKACDSRAQIGLAPKSNEALQNSSAFNLRRFS